MILRHNFFNPTVLTCTAPLFGIAIRWHLFKNIIFAYNKIFKYLLNRRGIFSMSQLYITMGIDHFKVLNRKVVLNMLRRVTDSENKLVATIVNSSYFLFDSKMYKHWLNTLY